MPVLDSYRAPAAFVTVWLTVLVLLSFVLSFSLITYYAAPGIS